jgi:UDP-N-acetylglucosamine 2-epimerase (non-hydrolysing)
MNILICFGTRPEFIKVKSLINNLGNVKTCFTGQHSDLLKDVNVDYKLELKQNISNNRLNNIFSNILSFDNIFNNIDYVLVQGDTSTASAIALSAFNNSIKIIHLEAGLRSNNLKDPFPEEMNRQFISRLADIHLCPTYFNKENLLKENVSGKIYVVGNTGLDNISKVECEYNNQVLITMHRRDNHHNMDKWFQELEKIANNYSNIEFMIPLHPNPNVQKHKHIFKKVKVVEPMNHKDLVNYVKKCRFVISDSGGLQEECSYLNKKIIVCRKTTERPESIGIHSFMCNEPKELYSIVKKINDDYEVDAKCPYGDGRSWEKIKYIIDNMNLNNKIYLNRYINFNCILKSVKLNEINNHFNIINTDNNKYFYSTLLNDRVCNTNKPGIFYKDIKLLPELVIKDSLNINNFYLLFGEYANKNFHHFLIEVGFHILNIIKLKKSIPNLKIVINTNTKEGMIPLLKTFMFITNNFNEDDIIDLNIISNPLKGRFHHFYYDEKDGTNWDIACRSFSIFNNNIYNKSNKILLLSRVYNTVKSNNYVNLVQSRICINMENIKNMLISKYESDIIFTEQIESFKEQLNIINSHKILIVEMGSGISNLYFCENINVVIFGSETNKGWYDTWYSKSKELLNFKNINIYCVWGKVQSYDNKIKAMCDKSNENYDLQKPYIIDIELLVKTINNIL